jgi:hypothetical protein
MPKASGEAADQLESALLYLGRSPQELGVGLVLLLGSEQVISLAKNAGRRRAGMVDFAMILADAVLSSEKVRNAVVKALLDSLPEPLLLPELMLDEEHHEHLSRAAKLAVLAQELGSSDEESWESARLHIVAWAVNAGRCHHHRVFEGRPQSQQPSRCFLQPATSQQDFQTELPHQEIGAGQGWTQSTI